MAERLNLLRQVNMSLPIISFLVAFTVFSFGEAQPQLPQNLKPLTYELYIKVIPQKTSMSGHVTMYFQVLKETKYIVVNARHFSKLETIFVGCPNNTRLHVMDDKYNSKAETYTLTTRQNLREGDVCSVKFKFEQVLYENRMGFYSYEYEKGIQTSKRIAATKFEPAFARRAFPCIDEPQYKANFSITIAVSKGMTALSNSRLKQIGFSLYDAMDLYIFEETPKISTYSVAMAVFSFENRTITTQNRTFRIYGRRKFFTSDNYWEFALNHVKPTVEFFESYFNNILRISKLDLVGNPDVYYNSTATDSWGLLIVKESSLFCKSTRTRTRDIQGVLMTLIHGVSHQWIGSLVNPSFQSWGHFWINEGLATFFQYYALRELKPTWRAMDQFVIDILQPAMIIDATSPINLNPNPTPYDVHSPENLPISFKGASIIRMMYHFLTPKIFHEGLKDFIKNNLFEDHPVTATDSLIDNYNRTLDPTPWLEDKPKQDIIHKDVKSWDQIRGLPLVTATRDYETGKVHLNQTIFSYKNGGKFTKHWAIPINYVFSSKNLTFHNTSVDTWLRGKEMEILEAPTTGWMILNKNVTSYYRVNYDETNWKRLGDFLNSTEFEKIPAVNRAQLVDDSFNLARVGKLSYAVPFHIINYIPYYEKDYIPWKTLLTNLEFVREKISAYENYYKDFKVCVKNLCTKLFDLDINLYDGRTHIHELHREIVLKWRMIVDPSWKGTFNIFFDKWRGKQKVTPIADFQQFAVCSKMSRAGTDEYHFVMEQYASPDFDDNAKKRFLSGIGCLQDQVLIWEHLQKMSTFPANHVVPILESFYTQSNVGLTVVLEYLKTHSYVLRAKNVDIKSVFMGITKFITTDVLMIKLKEATEDNAVLEEARETLKWTENNIQQLTQAIMECKANKVYCNQCSF